VKRLETRSARNGKKVRASPDSIPDKNITLFERILKQLLVSRSYVLFAKKRKGFQHDLRCRSVQGKLAKEVSLERKLISCLNNQT